MFYDSRYLHSLPSIKPIIGLEMCANRTLAMLCPLQKRQIDFTKFRYTAVTAVRILQYFVKIYVHFGCNNKTRWNKMSIFVCLCVSCFMFTLDRSAPALTRHKQITVFALLFCFCQFTQSKRIWKKERQRENKRKYRDGRQHDSRCAMI